MGDDIIHAMHSGCEREVELRVSDISKIIHQLEQAERVWEALETFARVAEHDIGAYEHDDDRHVHMEKHNIADRLTVGDFRRALSAFSQVKDEEQ